MKAARWHGVKDIRVEDVVEPSPGAGEVKVKVAWTGICGSDLHEYFAGPIFVPVEQDHPLSHDKAPITMGHEYCGTVTELGDGVNGLTVGDRVAIEPIFACGTCPACLEGKYNLCDSLGRRQYDRDVLMTLSLITMGQPAGFTLAEIARMFGPDGRPEIPRADLHAKADALQRQIEELRLLSDLIRHVANCPAPSHLECPTFRKLMKAASDRQITNRQARKP